MSRFSLAICMIVALQSTIAESSLAGDCLIYSIRPDGTDLRVEIGANAFPGFSAFGSPDASPDGEHLVFDAVPIISRWSKSRIMVLRTGKDSKGEVSDLDCGNCPVWSPDGKWIAFSILGGNPKGFQRGTWIMDANCENAEFITTGRMPRWMPDGKSLITFSAGNEGLSKVDIETGEVSPFLDHFQHLHNGICHIRFSPDGKRVLTHVLRNEVKQLVTMDLVGSNDSIIVLAEGDLGYFAYSADGTRISYVVDNLQGGNDIFLVATDGKSKPTKLDVLPHALKEDFCWLKDGSRILFNAESQMPLVDD